MTATDVAEHQRRNFSAPRCTCKPVGAYHSPMCPVSLFVQTQLEPGKPAGGKRRGGKLRKHREPNQTEAEMGQIQEARRRRGDIVSAEFEAITLRWGDMTYTPDFFIIRQLAENHTEAGGGPLIETVFIEVKGGHKWEDSIVKYKAAKARFTWARFEMWQKSGGRWEQIG